MSYSSQPLLNLSKYKSEDQEIFRTFSFHKLRILCFTDYACRHYCTVWNYLLCSKMDKIKSFLHYRFWFEGYSVVYLFIIENLVPIRQQKCIWCFYKVFNSKLLNHLWKWNGSVNNAQFVCLMFIWLFKVINLV